MSSRSVVLAAAVRNHGALFTTVSGPGPALLADAEVSTPAKEPSKDPKAKPSVRIDLFTSVDVPTEKETMSTPSAIASS